MRPAVPESRKPVGAWIRSAEPASHTPVESSAWPGERVARTSVAETLEERLALALAVELWKTRGCIRSGLPEQAGEEPLPGQLVLQPVNRSAR